MQTKPRNFKGALTRRACRGDAGTSSRHLFYTHSPHGMQDFAPLSQQKRASILLNYALAFCAGSPFNY